MYITSPLIDQECEEKKPLMFSLAAAVTTCAILTRHLSCMLNGGGGGPFCSSVRCCGAVWAPGRDRFDRAPQYIGGAMYLGLRKSIVIDSPSGVRMRPVRRIGGCRGRDCKHTALKEFINYAIFTMDPLSLLPDRELLWALAGRALLGRRLLEGRLPTSLGSSEGA